MIDTCQLEQIDVFPKYPKLWNKKRNFIVELSDYYDVEVDLKYEYLIVFDFEVIQLKFEEEIILRRTPEINEEVSVLQKKKLNYINDHTPVL